ncbi:hypothetical protein KCU83_g7982, partial [Aureobasidium melanogenum]
MSDQPVDVFGQGVNATVKAGTKCPPLSPELMIGLGGYSCKTQEDTDPAAGSSSPDRIMLGWKKEIPRWKKGSVVTWAANYNGYPVQGQAAYAANKLNDAANEWNALDLGVSFKWIDDRDKANFVLKYSSTAGNTLAVSFFPNQDLGNNVTVFQTAFDPRNIQIMKNVFLHELGHALGLRHEFAAVEGDFVPFGSENEKSVMSYNFPPTMQDSDIKDTKAFYAYTGTSIGTYNISDKVPQPH